MENGRFRKAMSATAIWAGLVLGRSIVWTSGICTAASPPDAMVADLQFLASDELRGRDSTKPEIDIAADHIAKQFKEAGLKTELFDGSPFQTFDIPVGSRPTDPQDNFFELVGPALQAEEQSAQAGQQADQSPSRWMLDQGFSPLSVGVPKGEVEADLVWVGYGITAPEHDYDDYEGISVKGKIVVMLRKEPAVGDPKSPFNGAGNSRHAYFETKIGLAIDNGALGVLLVNDPVSIEKELEGIRKRRRIEENRVDLIEQSLRGLPAQAVNSRRSLEQKRDQANQMLQKIDEELATARQGVLDVATAGLQPKGGQEVQVDPATGQKSRRDPIPVGSIARDVVDHWLKNYATVAGAPERQAVLRSGLESVEAAIAKDLKPYSGELTDVRGTLKVSMTPAQATTKNVLAEIPGRGALAEETLVIGAHYDHVGMGGYGSLAPGTIAVHNGADDNASGTAVLLQVARQLNSQLATLDAHRRVLFIAFSGEERGLLGSRYYVDHPRYPLDQTVTMINMDMVGRLRDNELTVYGTGSAEMMDALLDEVNTTAKFKLFRIASGYGPSDHTSFYQKRVPVLFFFTGLHEDYHRPSDDFAELNLDGMTRITDMVCQVSKRLVTTADRPVYATTSKRSPIRRQLTVRLGVSLSQRNGHVVLSNVVQDNPADEAGLRIGDRLVTIGEEKITLIQEVMEQLRRRNPGDKLPVTVQRGGNQMTLTVRLEAR